MEKILEQFYKDELYPYSKFQATIEQFKIDKNEAFKSYSILLEKLPEELKGGFDELIDSYPELLPFELEQNFIDGSRTDTQIMAEVYASPIDNNEYS